MNIFFLAKNSKQAAKYHCDKHVVKMIVETAQLLSTAVRFNGVVDPVLYRQTHTNHPSAIWVRKSKQQYEWTCNLLVSLCEEYTLRYGKIHKTASKIDVFKSYVDIFPNKGWMDPPQCMPDDCKHPNTVTAYRNYYKQHKRHFATWKTKVPHWFE